MTYDVEVWSSVCHVPVCTNIMIGDPSHDSSHDSVTTQVVGKQGTSGLNIPKLMRWGFSVFHIDT